MAKKRKSSSVIHELGIRKIRDKSTQMSHPTHSIEVQNGVVCIVGRYAKLHEDYDDK